MDDDYFKDLASMWGKGWTKDSKPIWCLCCDGEMFPADLPDGSDRMPDGWGDEEEEEPILILGENHEDNLVEYLICHNCGWTIPAIDYEGYQKHPEWRPCSGSLTS